MMRPLQGFRGREKRDLLDRAIALLGFNKGRETVTALAVRMSCYRDIAKSRDNC